MPLDVLAPLSLYGAGLVLIAALVVKLCLVRIGRWRSGAAVLRIGLCSALGLAVFGLALAISAPA